MRKRYGYDENDLYDAMRNLGEAFDYAVNACHLDADFFMQLFIATGIVDSFRKGNPTFVSGLLEIQRKIITEISRFVHKVNIGRFYYSVHNMINRFQAGRIQVGRIQVGRIQTGRIQAGRIQAGRIQAGRIQTR